MDVSLETGIDAKLFRSVLGHFCSGITVLTACIDGKPVGMTCQSFFSVSVNPPMVAFCVGRGSSTFPVLRTADGLVINVLDAEQRHLSAGFARSGTDKWQGVQWEPGEAGGHPVLNGALAALECTIAAEVDAGDHILVLVEVRRLSARQEGTPLLYFRGEYHTASPHKPMVELAAACFLDELEELQENL
ncbi:flavin reductase family protein [Nocardioides immobilis]|uniref:flavin reductase family protein n=1 Tax=Nocardioides immobilis TaxID=2049295 RepID=UPI001C714CAA|nr:flavin reductase family protein [Nocardioides immobilis]